MFLGLHRGNSLPDVREVTQLNKPLHLSTCRTLASKIGLMQQIDKPAIAATRCICVPGKLLSATGVPHGSPRFDLPKDICFQSM